MEETDEIFKVISEFATNTRHKQALEPNVELTVKKYLATQCPIANFKKIYPFVADDMARIEFRAPNELSRYSTGVILQPKILSSILNTVEFKNKDEHYAIYKDYCDAVNPPIGKELITFFLHGQRDKNLHEMIASELGSDTDPYLYDRIVNYKPSKGFSTADIEREIGMMISNMTFPWIDYQSIDCAQHSSKDKEKEEEEEESEASEEISLPVAPTEAFTAEHERSLRTNPVMQAFKIENKLSNQFPSVKVAKQILISNITSNIEAKDLRRIMGKKQTTSNFKPYKLTSENWSEISSIVDHMDSDSIQSILDSKDAQLFNNCCNHGLTEGRALVKELLSIHAQCHDDRTEAYCGRYKKRASDSISHEIVNAIVNAKIN